MTDSVALIQEINNSGLKKNAIAANLGLTPYGFMRKVNGFNEFKVSEMEALCDILGIKDEQRQRIFFKKKVDK